MYAERVKGEWLTLIVDNTTALDTPDECMRVQRISDRWVFVREEIGGYEASNGNSVDTSWFELFAVVDGEIRRVFPLDPNGGYREVSSRDELRGKFAFYFVDDWAFLEWSADGRSIVQLVAPRPRRR